MYCVENWNKKTYTKNLVMASNGKSQYKNVTASIMNVTDYVSLHFTVTFLALHLHSLDFTVTFLALHLHSLHS